VIGTVLLVVRAAQLGTALHIVSFAIFGASLILLYLSSTVYHSTKKLSLRTKLRTVDHAAIYILIAGSYTPFALVILPGKIGWSLFGISWGMAVTGIVLKLFYTGRFNHLSTAMYVLMGWLIIFAIKPLMLAFPGTGLMLLFAGGISYTVGAISYSFKKLPFGHTIFHFFVLGGSACHFIAVYFYILPSA
jgi:hemolysin III